MARNFNTWVDDLTVKTDRTPGGNGTYETTEVVETFDVDANGYVVETLSHDAAGNLTFDGVFQFTYDAWNRLVKVTKAYRDGNGDLQLASVIQENAYDGMGWRIRRQVKNSADLDCTYHDYYTQGWQLIEQRNGSGQVLKQHVWAAGPSAYIDELVQNGLNDDPADEFEQDCETFHWAAQDANYNVLGVLDASAALVERYQYTAYGQRTVFFPAGASDGPAHAHTTNSRPFVISAAWQPYGVNDIGHQGLPHDRVSGLICNRARARHSALTRWMQREPLGYIDGLSLYLYVRSDPFYWLDPSGRQSIARPDTPGIFNGPIYGPSQGGPYTGVYDLPGAPEQVTGSPIRDGGFGLLGEFGREVARDPSVIDATADRVIRGVNASKVWTLSRNRTTKIGLESRPWSATGVHCSPGQRSIALDRYDPIGWRLVKYSDYKRFWGPEVVERTFREQYQKVYAIYHCVCDGNTGRWTFQVQQHVHGDAARPWRRSRTTRATGILGADPRSAMDP